MNAKPSLKPKRRNLKQMNCEFCGYEIRADEKSVETEEGIFYHALCAQLEAEGVKDDDSKGPVRW